MTPQEQVAQKLLEVRTFMETVVRTDFTNAGLIQWSDARYLIKKIEQSLRSGHYNGELAQ